MVNVVVKEVGFISDRHITKYCISEDVVYHSIPISKAYLNCSTLFTSAPRE